MGGAVGIWRWLSARPAWRRVARVSEQLAADGAILVVFMVIIYLVSVVAGFLHIQDEEIAFGVTMAHFIRWLHAANFIINGYYALKHLRSAHGADENEH
jgi:hypothetical protein